MWTLIQLQIFKEIQHDEHKQITPTPLKERCPKPLDNGARLAQDVVVQIPPIPEKNTKKKIKNLLPSKLVNSKKKSLMVAACTGTEYVVSDRNFEDIESKNSSLSYKKRDNNINILMFQNKR